MKIETTTFGSFSLISENAQDQIWLRDYVKVLAEREENHNPDILIDFEESCCLKDPLYPGGLRPACGVEMKKVIEELLDENKECWEDIEKIEFSALEP